MTIPDYQSLMRPLLLFGKDGTEKNIRDAISSIAKQIKLTEEEFNQLLPSGKQTLFSNRVHWARTYLDKAGALKRTRRSHFIVTERGQKLLAEHPDRIDVNVLRQFPEFVAFQSPKASDESSAKVDVPDLELVQTSATPEEAIQSAELQILDHLRSELLESIGKLSPNFF